MINYIATSVQNERGFVVHKSKRNKGSHDNFSYTILFIHLFLWVGHIGNISIQQGPLFFNKKS